MEQGEGLSRKEQRKAESLHRDRIGAEQDLAATQQKVAANKEAGGPVDTSGDNLFASISRGNAVAEAAKDFEEKPEKYKQQAVNEAQAQGVDVNYPPYTNEPSAGEGTLPDQS